MEIYRFDFTHPSELKRWSIVFPAECRVRHVNQTGGDYYACIGLGLEPYDGPENIAFVNAFAYSDYLQGEKYPLSLEDFNACIQGVWQGVETFLREKVEAGCPMAHLLVTLTFVGTHRVDSSPQAFARAAILGMRECFAKGGLIRID